MKKYISVFICLLLLFSLAGCNEKSEITENTKDDTSVATTTETEEKVLEEGEYETLSELNEALDVAIVSVEGATDETFKIVDDLYADYRFVKDGFKYSIRASHNLTVDITGQYTQGQVGVYMDGMYYTAIHGGNVKSYSFPYEDISYAFMVSDSDNNMSDDEFMNQYSAYVDSLIADTISPALKSLVGRYIEENTVSYLNFTPIFKDKMNAVLIDYVSEEPSVYGLVVTQDENGVSFTEELDGKISIIDDQSFTISECSQDNLRDLTFRKLKPNESLAYDDEGRLVIKKSYEIADFVGTYSDSFSERAVCELSMNEDNESLHMLVSWGSSANEHTSWVMDVKYVGGLLEYSNCECGTTIYDDATGKDSYEAAYTNAEGYFTINNGSLCWTGAYDEYCRDCVFVPDMF